LRHYRSGTAAGPGLPVLRS